MGAGFSSAGVGQTIDLNASVSSGLAVLYSVSDTSVAELAVDGNGDFNRLKIKAAGTITITQATSDSSGAPAPPVTKTATFNKSEQTISFDEIPEKSVGDFNFIPSALTAGLDVTFTSSNSSG